MGWKTAKPRTDFVGKAEQVQLDTQLAVVATLSFLDQLQMVVERLLRFPRSAVDALQAGIVLIAAPVGGGASGQLECRDVLGGRDVRSAAQITPNPFPGSGIEVVVSGELVAADLHNVGVTGFVVDEFELVRLSGQLLARLVLGLVDAPVEQLPVFDDLAHPLFQLLQILRRERIRHVEVVVEAVGDRRPDPQFGVREQVLDGLGQHVRGGVPDDAATVVGIGGDRGDLGVGVRDPAQVAQLALGVSHHHDRIGGTAARQPGVAHRGGRSRPGRHPDRRCWDGVCEGGHRRGLQGFRVCKLTRPCYRGRFRR